MTGKFRRGHGRANKLTNVQVYDIRRRYAEGDTQGSLAKAFNVSVIHIGRIVRGESRLGAPTFEVVAEPTAEELNQRGWALAKELGQVGMDEGPSTESLDRMAQAIADERVRKAKIDSMIEEILPTGAERHKET